MFWFKFFKENLLVTHKLYEVHGSSFCLISFVGVRNINDISMRKQTGRWFFFLSG